MEPKNILDTDNVRARILSKMDHDSMSIQDAFSYLDVARSMLKDSPVLSSIADTFAQNISNLLYEDNVPGRHAFMLGAELSMPLCEAILGYSPKYYPDEDATIIIPGQVGVDKEQSTFKDNFTLHITEVSNDIYDDVTKPFSGTLDRYIAHFCNDNSVNEAMFKIGFGMMIGFAQQSNKLQERRDQKMHEELSEFTLLENMWRL